MPTKVGFKLSGNMASAENQFSFKHSSNRKLLQACKHTSQAMSAKALNFQACNNPTQAKQLESNNQLAQEEGQKVTMTM